MSSSPSDLASGSVSVSRAADESERRYQQLVESIRDYAIFMLDTEGRVRSWNPGAQAIKGYAASEIIGQHLSVFYTPEDRAAGKPARLLLTAAEQGRVDDEGWCLRKDGSRFWSDVVISAIRDDSGALVGFSKVARDLSDRRASQEALRQSEARFAQMIGSVKDYAIFLLDENGIIRTWNAGAQLAKGYQAEEIIGRSISTFYTPEDRAAGRPQMLLARAVRDGRVEDEGWRVRKDGTRFWADVVITALRDEHGRLNGFTKVTRDLTLRRQADEALRQSEERFRVLVQSVKDYAIFMLDPKGVVATWNSGAHRIIGYAPEEIIGKHFSVFYPPEDVASGKSERELETSLLRGKFEEEGWRIRKDGSRFWASVVLEPLRGREGSLLGFAKVTRDLTERQAAEKERLRLVKADEAIRLRDEFLSIASHELKTPLTAVHLQLQGLLRSAMKLDERVGQKLTRAVKSGERLSDLIETLLDVSRIATGRFELSRTQSDLKQTVEEVVERLREQAQQSDSAVTVEVDGRVVGQWDRLRLEQVLHNLLANAFKYAAGTPVRVTLRERQGTAVLIVEDRGPGIPVAERERVFERFERAASMRHYGGMGLGLYVARQIVEAHGGRIHIEGAEPTGARFVVQLPVETRSAAAPAEASGA